MTEAGAAFLVIALQMTKLLISWKKKLLMMVVDVCRLKLVMETRNGVRFIIVNESDIKPYVMLIKINKKFFIVDQTVLIIDVTIN